MEIMGLTVAELFIYTHFYANAKSMAYKDPSKPNKTKYIK